MQNYITATDILSFFPELSKDLNTKESKRNFNLFSARLSQFANIQRIFANIDNINNINTSGYSESETITLSDNTPFTLNLGLATQNSEINPNNGIGFSRNSDGFFRSNFGTLRPDVPLILELACTPQSPVRLVSDSQQFLSSFKNLNLNNKVFNLGETIKGGTRLNSFFYREVQGDVSLEIRKDYDVTFGAHGQDRQRYYRYLIASLDDVNSGSINPSIPQKSLDYGFLGFVFFPPRYGDETWGDEYGVYFKASSTGNIKTPVAIYVNGERYDLSESANISGIKRASLYLSGDQFIAGEIIRGSRRILINGDVYATIQYIKSDSTSHTIDGDENKGKWLILFENEQERDNPFSGHTVFNGREITQLKYKIGENDFATSNVENYELWGYKTANLIYERQDEGASNIDHVFETDGGVEVFSTPNVVRAGIYYLRADSTGDDTQANRGKWIINFGAGSTSTIFPETVTHFVYQVGGNAPTEVPVTPSNTQTGDGQNVYLLKSTAANHDDPSELSGNQNIEIRYAFKYEGSPVEYSFGKTYALISKNALTTDPEGLPTSAQTPVPLGYNFILYDRDIDLPRPAYDEDFNEDVRLYKTTNTEWGSNRITQDGQKVSGMNIEFSDSTKNYPDFLGFGENNSIVDLDTGVYFQEIRTTRPVRVNYDTILNLNDGKYLQALQVAHIATLAYFDPSGGTPIPLNNINVGADSQNFVFDKYWDKTKYGKLLSYLLRQSGLVGLSISTPRYY